ncbi:Vacuolar protein sorting/targeting protein 10 [Thelohanellus kitauei]|uniref:Vacuolar protein sorting/targeting protein 10 n=1 Tax=Thelohanellus kitauei TaxID=669202 RepID=A0A0C2MJ75_THEKT|nr:Vacuolar protein sorting/targeting protein 10 [Thelohanellus kitauei]
MLDKYDVFVQIICDLAEYDSATGNCPVVINPHLPGVIYINLKQAGKHSITYTSHDDGKHFKRLQLEEEHPDCNDNNCGFELDLNCSSGFMANSFPTNWIVKINGIFHKIGSRSNHSFVSFNGGLSWKMLDTRIEQLTIVNNGGLMVGHERKKGKIWYSYNEGRKWLRVKIKAYNCIDIIPLSFDKYRVLAVINYKEKTRTYKLSLLKFNRALSMMYLMIGTQCDVNDFDTWYVPRYQGTCFQGEEMIYLKKKPLPICFDNRTSSLPTINACPCSLEDFHWYSNINDSKTNYFFKDNLCLLDTNLNLTESSKICLDGGKPLNHLNGYELYLNRFAQLDSDLCYPRETFLIENSNYSDYCISVSNIHFISDFSIRIYVIFPDQINECEFDNKGYYLPASFFKKYDLPMTISSIDPITYNINGKEIYLYKNHKIFRYFEELNKFTKDEVSLYQLNFDIVEITHDYINSFIFILDTKHRLFALSLANNYIKFLTSDVIDFSFDIDTM